MLGTYKNVPTAVGLSGQKRRHVRRCFTYCLTVCFHNKSVMVLEGISSLENANIFFPKSFSEAPI